MGITRADMGLIMSIAKVSDSVWEPLLKIFQGETEAGVAGIPKSSTHMVKMSKIPDEQLVEWLNEVVEGELEMKMFKQRCAQWKHEQTLWAEVTSICQEFLSPEDTGLTSKQIEQWQSDLSSEDAERLLRQQFPGLQVMIQDRAIDCRNLSAKDLLAGNFMARCKAHCSEEKKSRSEAAKPVHRVSVI